MSETQIIGNVLYFGAFAGLLYAGYRWLRYRSLSAYRTTTGTVTRSEIVTRRDGGNMALFVAEIEYAYEFARRRYTGRVINGGGDIWTSSRERTHAIQSRYPVGRQVEVHFDPRQPARCYLERSLAPLLSGVAATLLCGALGTLLRSW